MSKSMQLPRGLYTAIKTLGMLGQFNLVAQSKSFEEVTQRLEFFKQEAKQAFKTLSRTHHPDLGGDIEQMKALSAAYDEIKRMQIVRPRPQPMMRVVYVYHGPASTSTWTSGAGTTSTGVW